MDHFHSNLNSGPIRSPSFQQQQPQQPQPPHHRPASPLSPAPPSVSKRRQVKNACVNCQRACKKCDECRPCGRCVKYGLEESCLDSQRKERKRKTNSGGPSAHSPSHSITGGPSQVRLLLRSPSPLANTRHSSRGTIRPLPLALLKTLKDEMDEEDAFETPDENGSVGEDSHGAQDPVQKPAVIAPRVTEDFKTLAQLCSDLHVLFTASPPPPTINIPMPMPLAMVNSTSFTSPYFTPMTPNTTSSSCSSSISMPIPIPCINMGSPSPRSPSPSSQFHLQATPPSSPGPHHYQPPQTQVPHSTDVPQQQPSSPARNFLNRTPPDEEEPDKFEH